jgi:subtilase family serine protease
MLIAKVLVISMLGVFGAQSQAPGASFNAAPPVHIHKHFASKPNALISPNQTKQAYHLNTGPNAGAGKTVAIVDAYDDPNALKDLNTFNNQYFPGTQCNSNTCFEKHQMSFFTSANKGWALEESLDVQWAHAIAPGAKILLVEARSAGLSDLMSAVDYARKQPNVASVSMSWGGGEFSGQTSYDTHFTPGGNNAAVSFFASSGDEGSGVQWPASSTNVIGVGGTTLKTDSAGNITSESAWSGSGGGVSAQVSLPTFQQGYGLAGNKRQIPDVSYDADPATGFPVYDSYGYSGQRGWFQVGGTSAGAPQWAAINAVNAAAGSGFAGAKLYTDGKADALAEAAHQATQYFNDIVTGANGSCGTLCIAGPAYDTVTGLGSPASYQF